MVQLFGRGISCRPVLLMFVSVVVELGCASTSEFAPMRIVIEQHTTNLARTTETQSFSVNAAIFNDGPKPLYLAGCGPEAQRQIDNQWHTIWSPICVGSPGMTQVAPGDSLKFPVVVLAYTKPNMEPALDPRFQAGLYRLRFALGENGSSIIGPNALRLHPSSEFTVVDPPLQ